MTTEHAETTELEVGYTPPFLRISAGYPATMDRRLPEHINIELNVDDVTEDSPVDGQAFDSNFTRFVCEIVGSLGDVARSAAPSAATTLVISDALMSPAMAERLANLADGHAADCDGKCDEQSTDPADGDKEPVLREDQYAGLGEPAAASAAGDSGKADA